MACTGGMATTVRRRVARRAAVQRPPPRRVCAPVRHHRPPSLPRAPAAPAGQTRGARAFCARLNGWGGGVGPPVGGGQGERARRLLPECTSGKAPHTHTRAGGAGGALPPTLVAGRMGLSHGCRCVGEGRVGGLCCARLGASVQTAVVGGGVNPQPPDRPPHLLFLSLKPVEPLPPHQQRTARAPPDRGPSPGEVRPLRSPHCRGDGAHRPFRSRRLRTNGGGPARHVQYVAARAHRPPGPAAGGCGLAHSVRPRARQPSGCLAHELRGKGGGSAGCSFAGWWHWQGSTVRHNTTEGKKKKKSPTAVGAAGVRRWPAAAPACTGARGAGSPIPRPGGGVGGWG